MSHSSSIVDTVDSTTLDSVSQDTLDTLSSIQDSVNQFKSNSQDSADQLVSDYTFTSQTTGSSLMAQLVFILVNTISVYQAAEYAWADMESWVSQKVYDISVEEDAAMTAAYQTLDNDIDNGKSDNKISEDLQKCTDVQQEYSNELAPWQQMQSTYSTFLQELSTSLSQITNDISSVEAILSLPATLMA